MANCWKRVTHRTPPPSATIGRPNRDGVASAVWTDSKGNKHKREATKAADGSWRLLMESYSIKYRDHRGVVVTETTGLTNKELAERLLSEKLDMVERIKSGRISASELRTMDRAGLPMSQLVSEFVATVQPRAYRSATAMYLARFTESYPTIRPAEIDSRVIQRWIDERASKGDGGGTLEKSRSALSLFVKWLYKTDVLAQPTVLVVELPKLPARRPKRAFTVTEIQQFLDAVESPERRMIYLFAASSGLRGKEVSSVLVGDLEGLTSDKPFIRLNPLWTKNRCGGCQPLQPAVGVLLADWVRSQNLSPEDRLFRTPCRSDFSRWMLGDLERAGLPHIAADGRRLSFHSLRKSFVSWMLASGQDLRTVQALARHSTPTLTASAYTDESLLDGRSALLSLPSLTVTPVTPTVTPTGGVTSDLVTIQDNSTGLPDSLFQAESAENEALEGTAVAYCDNMPVNRVSALFPSTSVEMPEDRDTRIDTLVDEAMASLSDGGLGLSRNELALLFMKLSMRLASTVGSAS